MRNNISDYSSKGGKAFAKRLREDLNFRKVIIESRKKRRGTSWIKLASLKGVEVRRIIRENKHKRIQSNLLKKLEDEQTHLNIARLCGFLSGDGHI